MGNVFKFFNQVYCYLTITITQTLPPQKSVEGNVRRKSQEEKDYLSEII